MISRKSFPIKVSGMDFKDRAAMFRYIIDTSAAYYDVVDVVREGVRNALVLSTTEPDPYYNYCVHKDGGLEDCIKNIRPVFQEFGRIPMIYITPASIYYGADLKLEEFARDGYMFLADAGFLENYKIDDSIKIDLCEDANLFSKIFDLAYRGKDDVYGCASEREIDGMKKFFAPPAAGFDCFATMAYKDGIPAACAMAAYNKDFLIVVELGTLPELRGRGIGTALMKDIVERSGKLGIKAITLQTESGTYNEKYYEKIGFKTEFYGIYCKA